MEDHAARSFDEVREHVHPLLPNPGAYELVHMAFDIDPRSQTASKATIKLRAKGTGTIRAFEFTAITSTDYGPLQLPTPLGTGIWLVDITYRQWSQQSVEVLQDYEEAPVLFWAAGVREVTQPSDGNGTGDAE